MSKIAKSYVRKLRAEAKYDRAFEDLHERAPGHMTMRTVEALEHKQYTGNTERQLTALLLLFLSHLIEGPFWLELIVGVLALAAFLVYVVMFAHTWLQTKAPVLTVLENHAHLKAEADAERG